jgi:hypothetical protein
MVLYKDCSICPDQLTNIAATSILLSYWSTSKKSSPLKLLGQMNRNFGRKHRWKVYKECLFTSKPLPNMVTTDKILEIGQSETTSACGGHVC